MLTLPVPESFPSKPDVQRTTSTCLACILDAYHLLCKEDIIWMLNVIKQQLANYPEKWMLLEPAQFIHHSHCFAKISLLINQIGGYGQESDRIRKYLTELITAL